MSALRQSMTAAAAANACQHLVSGAHFRQVISPLADKLEAADGRTRLITMSGVPAMIRKLPSGEYRLYSRKASSKTGKRRNLGTFASRSAAMKHEKAVQYFKRR
jgi:hypothetical protein